MDIVTPPPSNFLMTLANIAATLLSLYSMLIWIRIILTWIRVPGSQWNNGGNPFLNFLSKIVDPYLNLFSGITPLRRSHLDFTPLVAMAVLSIVQSLLRIFGAYGRITLGLVLGLVIRTLWSYIFSLFFWFFIIMLIIRLVFCYRRSPNAIQYIQMLDSMLGGLFNWVQKVFFRNKPVNDRNLVIASLIFTVCLYILAVILVNLAVGALGKLPL
ncbi:MAG: YggT family protein [Sphaerochaetaceae bacterium]|nr:YggT family protein [Sphaerochaetaceae bacterium]